MKEQLTTPRRVHIETVRVSFYAEKELTPQQDEALSVAIAQAVERLKTDPALMGVEVQTD